MCDLGELQQGMLRLPKKKAEKKKKWGLIIGNSTVWSFIDGILGK